MPQCSQRSCPGPRTWTRGGQGWAEAEDFASVVQSGCVWCFYSPKESFEYNELMSNLLTRVGHPDRGCFWPSQLPGRDQTWGITVQSQSNLFSFLITQTISALILIRASAKKCSSVPGSWPTWLHHGPATRGGGRTKVGQHIVQTRVLNFLDFCPSLAKDLVTWTLGYIVQRLRSHKLRLFLSLLALLKIFCYFALSNSCIDCLYNFFVTERKWRKKMFTHCKIII